jgi:acyl-coenzyme A thioesterase PaaI-like protein
VPDALLAPDLSGYNVFDPSDPFEDYVGPVYYRRLDHGVHCLLPTEPRHANGGSALHGGVLLTFADYALCAAAGHAASGGQMPGSFAMTLSLTVQFLAGGEIGPAIESMGEATQVTGRLAFVRGSVTQGGRRLVTYSGVCRHVARDKAMGRRSDNGLAAVAGGTRPPGPPDNVPVPEGYAPVLRPSPFTTALGPVFYRQEDEQVHVVQPTFPYMLNSGASFHGGMLMTFADNALCTSIAANTGKAPWTATFSAEFLAGSNIGAPLESTVDLARVTRSLAFTTGVVTQAGKKLLSYSATVALKNWDGAGTPQART